MASHSTGTSEAVEQYMNRWGVRIDPLMQRLINETREVTGDQAFMQVSPAQGALLTLLARLVNATSALEIGTFTGFSAISIALGLKSGGRLTTCDINEQWSQLAQQYFVAAGVDDRIQQRIIPALDLVRNLPDDPCLDFVFLDGDKPHYPDLFSELVPRLRPGALLLVDNVLWGGRVADRRTNDEWTQAIHRFNELAHADERLDLAMLPLGDGLTLLRRTTDKGHCDVGRL